MFEPLRENEAKVLALCIGIDEYKHGNALNNCVSDAKRMQAKFNGAPHACGLLHCNAQTKEDLLVFIRTRFVQDMDRQGGSLASVVMFFAGHAVQRTENGCAEIYLVMGDSELGGTSDSFVSLREITELLADAAHMIRDKLSKLPKYGPAHFKEKCHLLFIIDACRDSGESEQQIHAGSVEHWDVNMSRTMWMLQILFRVHRPV